jgi:hypothetical protein
MRIAMHGMPFTGEVCWLKALDGMPKKDSVISASSAMTGMSAWLNEMGNDLAGGPDALAIYVKTHPNPFYQDGRSTPGTIAGLAWLAHLPQGSTVRHRPLDDRYDLGWPVADVWRPEQARGLKDLVTTLYAARADQVWKRLCGSLRGGRPVRIGAGDFAPIGEALTHFCQRAGAKEGSSVQHHDRCGCGTSSL